MPKPRLQRLDLVCYKRKSATDATQVPAAGATIRFYRQGATVSSPVTVGPFPTLVEVYDTGKIVNGDLVFPNGDSTKSLIASVVSATQLELSRDIGDAVSLVAGTRLLFGTGSHRPNLYGDPFGTVALGSDAVADENGRVTGYIDEEWFDYEILDGGANPIHADAVGRVEVQSAWSVNIRDYQTLDDAMAALPSGGGRVGFPVGEYVLESGLVISRSNIILAGEGLGSIIRPKATNENMDLVTVRSSQVEVRNLRLGHYDPNGLKSRTALCIDSNYSIENIVLDNVQMEGGIVAGLTMSADVKSFRASACLWLWNGEGVRISRYGSARLEAELRGCEWASNRLLRGQCGDGIGIGFRFVDESGGLPRTWGVLRFVDCSFEGNQGGLDALHGNAISVEGAGMSVVEILGCYFENPDSDSQVTGQQFVYLKDCDNASVDGGYFLNSDLVPGTPRIEYAVRYVLCNRLRHSNNVAPGPIGAQMVLEGSDGLEFGNRNLFVASGQIPPIVADLDSALGLLSLSAAAVSLYRCTLESRPAASDVSPGAMIWVLDPEGDTGPLQVAVRPQSGDPYWSSVALA